MHTQLYTGAGRGSVPSFKPLLTGLLGGLCLLTACKSMSESSVQQKARLIAHLVEDAQQVAEYQFRDGTETQPIEQQWSVIESDHGIWHYTEIFSVFRRPDGNLDYGLLEMSFDANDTLNRFKVLEYQLLQSEDSSWYTSPTVRQGKLIARLTYEFQGKSYKLYGMEGYAHANDPQPGHLKYWSPELGTVLIWFGEERFFELVKVGGGEKEGLLRQALSTAIANLKEFE